MVAVRVNAVASDRRIRGRETKNSQTIL